jgi:PAS domain S-box-containing protein
MLYIFTGVFDTENFMPHGHCYLWTPELVWLHVISDSLVALAYFSIPLTLVYFIRKRKDLPFNWMFAAFSIFILACGATHFMEVLTVWNPVYWASGIVKFVTAAASVPTAVLLTRLVPKALLIPSQAQLEEANRMLQREVVERKRAEEVARRASAELEMRIAERTKDLTKANEDLRREIDERKRAEAALVESEELFRLLVEGVSDYGIYMLDPRGYVVSWNEGAKNRQGYSPEEIIGKHYSCFFTDEDIAAGKPMQELEQATAEGRLEFEEWRVRKDGSRFWGAVLLTPLRDGDGQVRGFSKVTRDITERKQAEQFRREVNIRLERRVAERTAQLEAANKELEAFSYTVSHDLRAPLRHIDGFVQLLNKREGERLEPTSARYLRIVAEAANKMGKLIDELLALSRTGRIDMKMQRIELNSLLDEVRRELAPLMSNRKIRWDVSKLPPVEGDSTLIKLVLINLLSNALKYTSPRREALIEIGSGPGENGHAVIFVKDNGVGFNMKYKEKLFGVFQRLHRDEEFEGTGIGLATVRRIIHRHGGRVWGESVLEGGATFYFSVKAFRSEK